LRRVLSPRCLWEITHDWDDDLDPSNSRWQLKYTLETLSEQAARTGRQDVIQPIHSLKQLDRVLRDLWAAPDAAWPPPPAAMAGIPGLIEPLATRVALAEEGFAMQHCVETLAGVVARGHSLLFRIHANAAAGTDRATLELKPGPDGQWRIAQLLGSHNQPVSEKTRQTVEAWRVRAHAAMEATIDCLPSAAPPPPGFTLPSPAASPPWR
jgi:hypothetical protein